MFYCLLTLLHIWWDLKPSFVQSTSWEEAVSRSPSSATTSSSASSPWLVVVVGPVVVAGRRLVVGFFAVVVSTSFSLSQGQPSVTSGWSGGLTMGFDGFGFCEVGFGFSEVDWISSTAEDSVVGSSVVGFLGGFVGRWVVTLGGVGFGFGLGLCVAVVAGFLVGFTPSAEGVEGGFAQSGCNRKN